MFAKPYKLKANNTLKNSEKKHLLQWMQQSFPNATEDKLKELVPSKSTVIFMKLIVHSGEMVGVYVVDSVPVMLEVGERLVPTVCGLWKVPQLVPTWTIHSPVLPKVQGGAPLYVPGVVRSSATEAGTWVRGAAVGARTEDNMAAALVGRATISSADMFFATGGVCLETINVVGDLLCRDDKFNKIERPLLQPDTSTALVDNITAQVQHMQLPREAWPALGRPAPACPPAAPAPSPPAPAPHQPALIADCAEEPAQPEPMDDTCEGDVSPEELSRSEEAVPQDMEGLLRWCLLGYLKQHGRSAVLPLKTNLLYKNHLIPLCPPARTLDVKKSSYKKMSKFLDAMQQEGLIEVREIEKGVDAITAVNTSHSAVRAHRGAAAGAPGPLAADGAPADYVPPLVREMYAVTAAVVEIFAPMKKGTTLTAAEVREAVVHYVRSNNLAGDNKNVLALDGALAAVLNKQPQECVRWDELMAGVQHKMTSCTEMRFADGAVQLTKTKLEPIKMQTVTRSGNKKVTLVSNLEAFGFRLAPLARSWQQRAAAAAGVTRAPGAKHDQLQLQGDQTYFVAKQLVEKYGIPKKFVEGADKALKKKK